jgi:branched-chain amino acid transport system ATP-binding protein
MSDHHNRPQDTPALECRNLKVRYGGIQAVKGVSFSVRQGELVTLIGANGAGKTTTLKAITGLLAPAEGEILFHGKPINGMPAHQLPAQGLVMVPEGRGVFTRMSILENLLMGAYCRKGSRADSGAAHQAGGNAASAGGDVSAPTDVQIRQEIDAQLTLFPRLGERLHQLAGTLSGGEQQMLAMARALMAKPSVLLLDEPSMGLSPVMVERIFDVIRDVSRSGVTILLVEQNARLALQAAHRGYVMESGIITTSADAAALLDDPAVRVAYLGE